MTSTIQEEPIFRHAVRFGPIYLGAGFILVSLLGFLRTTFPIFLLNYDNLHLSYPLFKYLLDNLTRGEISYYHPFLFAGERLLGNPILQPNPIQLLAGLIFDPTAIFSLLNVGYLLEPVASFLGLYLFLGVLRVGLPDYTRSILALVYVLSFGYLAFALFPYLPLHFATLPWILYFIGLSQDHRPLLIFVPLTLVFYIQFAYGSPQFSVYLIWMSSLFALFWTPWPKKLRVMTLSIAATFSAVLASAHFLLPMIDNLYFSESAPAGRVVEKLDIFGQIVPSFYLVRLFVPAIFEYPIFWWPAWKSGRGPSEWFSAFNAFQGVPLSLLALFGLFLPSIPRFFRIAYVFLIASIVLPFGIGILYFLNLGSAVAYGRQTVLIGFVAPIIAGYAIGQISRNWRIAAEFAAWCSVAAIILMLPSVFGFPFSIVDYAFRVAGAASPGSYDPNAATEFYAAYSEALQKAFSWPFVVAIVSAIIAATVCFLLRFRLGQKKFGFPTFLTSMLCFVALAQEYRHVSQLAGHYYTAHIGDAKSIGGWYTSSLGIHHPVEDALIAAGAQVRDGPVAYRMHIDIPFAEHVSAAMETRRLSGARPQENRFRTLPNVLASERIAVTTGYQSIIPQAADFFDVMFQNPAVTFERGVGARTFLHPSILQAFGIRWVLRHQPAFIARRNGQPDQVNDLWERRFLASSKLIYSDDTYRLYEYTDARPVYDVPQRVAFGTFASEVFRALENADQAWTTTAAIPEGSLDTLGPEYTSRITTEGPGSTKVLHQRGRILEVTGKAGSWTRLVVEAETPSLVLIGTKFDPWWRATVNGRPTHTIQANGLFAAVPVPAGKSEIMVQLRPYSVWAGMAISVAMMLMLALGFSLVPSLSRNMFLTSS